MSAEGVESANIVGYQQTNIPNGWSFKTVTFKNVSGATFDLTDIATFQGSGEPWGATGASRCLGNITIQKITVDGSYGTAYKYYSTSTNGELDGWQIGSKTAKVAKGEVTFAAGEGMIIFCNKSTGAKFQFSGEVELSDTTAVIPNGWAFSGNCTPVAVDLTEIGTLQGTGAAWGTTGASRCLGNITIQKITVDGSYGTAYKYYSTSTNGELDGWQVGSKTAKVAKGDVVFEPGEGFIVYCNKTTGAQLVFPKPVK